MWTPALSAGSSMELPFGLIFSTFMVSCMAGSSLFSIQIEKMKGEKLAVAIFATAAVAMLIVALGGNNTIKFLAMNVFELTVGMYFPTMGTMKGAIVPESKRAAIYNLYRIPLNFIVLFSLLTDLKPWQSFFLNFLMLGTATVLQVMLMKRREKVGNDPASGGSHDEIGASSSIGMTSSNDDMDPLLDSTTPIKTKEDEAV
jgi:MFS transporter, MFS domain-containing protein family, molybdate-anion transporter